MRSARACRRSWPRWRSAGRRDDLPVPPSCFISPSSGLAGGRPASSGLLASVSGMPAGPDWRLVWRVAGCPWRGISELDCGLDGQPPPGPDDFTVGMWHWGAPHPHGAPGWAVRVQVGGIPEPHPHLLAHEFQILASKRGFSAGTMARCAGFCRHDVPSCRQYLVAAALEYARFGDIDYYLTVSRMVSSPDQRGG
jgi:hypothetical protein